MHKVSKYAFPVEDYFSLDLPKGAEILTIQEQYGEPQLLALVEESAPNEKRDFRLVETGHLIRKTPIETLNYIGTFQLTSGMFTGYVFEIRRKK